MATDEPSPARRAADALVDRLDYPMFVATGQSGGENSGCLIGFATQCSIEPFRFLACISQANHTHRVATRAEAFAVHLLGREQREVAELFGGTTGDMVDKFRRVAWRPGPGGSPILDDCAAWVEGAVLDRVPLGDHLGLVLEPFAGGAGARRGTFTLSQASGLEPGHPA